LYGNSIENKNLKGVFLFAKPAVLNHLQKFYLKGTLLVIIITVDYLGQEWNPGWRYTIHGVD